MAFTHIHVHSQYSILDGAASIKSLVEKAKKDEMPALALTDHGTMYGIKEFHVACKKAGIKPILGCEVYVAKRSYDLRDEKLDRSGHHLVVLAKNHIGYKNLLKLCSDAYIKGFYYRPRVDKKWLEENHEGLIITTACLGGEIPKKIMANNIAEAEEAALWYKSVFGDDFYFEMQRHPNTDSRLKTEIWDNQQRVNKVLLELGKKLNIKVVATNDVHFTNETDAEAHDLLICLNTGKDIDDINRMRYTRQEWFKTTSEMEKLFADVPEAIANTQEIADKVEFYELNHAPIMPDFPMPEGFTLEADYLRHLAIEGAKTRYGDPIPESNLERINFELDTIISMGFPGYFLIVQDFIAEARRRGVLVGPGRGSAAGSAVSYCLGITNIDPIGYDLLFERFLNPDRISMPDVDIDFDDDGRQEVLNYVSRKYGQQRVAHICTFGTMAAKSSIKDVARVLKLPLSEANRLAKMVPDTPKITLPQAYKESKDLLQEKEQGDALVKKTIQLAEALEGSVRQTGVHACGILIGKNDLWENIPLMPSKDDELYTTQYDGHFVEDIGLLKMDFLGLKTLSIIKECLVNIKNSTGETINIDTIPLDDAKTYELFSKGETTAIFQFESAGMKKYLKALKPNRLEDLVAMNALYRPGPMDYIPDFINRKHGISKIEYDHPIMESYLKSTYGITVYQEQVMLQSRALGGFTRGESDSLRKAMGKKNKELMEQLKAKFASGCLANPEFISGCEAGKKEPQVLIDKIWKDWEAFASYAFNKSHSVCYAFIAYQTGYLKAHYPSEFMSAVLSRNLGNSENISFFMDECSRMGISVMSPNVNKSLLSFSVGKNGEILFGLGAIKGVGEGASQIIIDEREKNGPYKDIFDFVSRVNLRSVNKKNMENLAKAGAFDCFGIERYRYFAEDISGNIFIETLIRFGGNMQNKGGGSTAPSLFGDTIEVEIPKLEIPIGTPWTPMQVLAEEKELVGIYLSSHPLDEYKVEIMHYCKTPLTSLENLQEFNGKDVRVAGMVSSIKHGEVKASGKPYGVIKLEDFSGSFEFFLMGKDLETYRPFMNIGDRISVSGKIEPRYGKESEFSLKIKSIEPLSEIKKKIKGISLKVKIEDINEQLINEMSSFAVDQKQKDGLAVSFLVYNSESNIWVQMPSKSYKMNLSRELIAFLDETPILEFKLN
ncbi:MAG: DNA polymerase III subunit alpha [Bacteroidales bacterium]|nr:DNA polymerase III subunit alpha [Bacteroidales bacterium]